MKVCDAVARFLWEQGVEHVFGVNGGANLWLIHGLSNYGKTKFIPTATESGAGFAADSYARLRGFGVAMATSGPGATGLTTAISASWQDSTPVLYITGNVATFRKGKPMGVRAYGFQELDFVRMIKGVTKFAYQPQVPERVIYTLEIALHSMRSGRKGPVVVDLCDDIQRMEV